ncbi:MAG: bifunctional methylenetetrahydrofolate dehydrogenase/methenyltetrahydrofolate cyclohydrolase FolD [Balneolales bacterium]|nr:bifunctional methylenetetrahydrofolate dehydrogenase/methenyltetrahydrofolate cyclohydrolase FolD [Balneolales bacterium]
MSASILDGKFLSQKIRASISADVLDWVEKGNRTPKLQVILVGENPASETYVGAKTKACKDVGIESDTLILPDTVSEYELKGVISEFNKDQNTDGILIQLPIPDHIRKLSIIEAIDHRKDVDGFHPMNIGRLTVGQPSFRPCTPAGILEMLNYYSIPTKGKHAVVVGASNIVGSPVAVMLSRENNSGKATTTICHKFTKDLTKHTIDADLLIVATGQPGLITGQMVKEGVVVIDVGITRVADHTTERGYRLAGDCDFDTVAEKASWITPVPGGVGPMTVAMLMKNTLLAAKNSIYTD